MICLISRQPYGLHVRAVSEIREGIDKVLIRLFEFEVTRPVFKFSKLIPQRPQIDLETVRETLLYIESDCRDCPELERVATAIARVRPTMVDVSTGILVGGPNPDPRAKSRERMERFVAEVLRADSAQQDSR